MRAKRTLLPLDVAFYAFGRKTRLSSKYIYLLHFITFAIHFKKRKNAFLICIFAFYYLIFKQDRFVAEKPWERKLDYAVFYLEGKLLSRKWEIGFLNFFG